MQDESFRRAYERGVLAAKMDYRWHWRAHIGLWVASSASKLTGDFVECGVNRGCLSSIIMEYLDWDSRDTMFWLMDTFSGTDERYVSNEEIEQGVLQRHRPGLIRGLYTNGVESVRASLLPMEECAYNPRANSRKPLTP